MWFGCGDAICIYQIPLCFSLGVDSESEGSPCQSLIRNMNKRWLILFGSLLTRCIPRVINLRYTGMIIVTIKMSIPVT
jgi:hypothetical protein